MLVRSGSSDSFARREAGGKGYNLYLMSRLGLEVPEWVALGRGTYERFVAASGIGPGIDEILDGFAAGTLSGADAAARIQERIESAALPPTIAAEIDDAHATFEPGATISVRSSAADEDGAVHSFAGQLSSFLYVAGCQDVIRCVKRCWASGFSERALAYRRENRLSLRGVAVAVVLQRMVDPDVSGVLFTCDPALRDARTFVTTAVYGVGEGLVSGALDADTFWIDAGSGEVARRQIAAKTEAFRRGGSGECLRVPVDERLRDEPSLSGPQILELHRIGTALAGFHGQPQDIEWAIANGRIFVLQTRPVTALDENLTGFPNLWDNSNIVESYGGPTLPLSFTFALRNYEAVYVQFCEILGVPRSVIREMESYLGNMLGCIDGRVYYNLYNWYKLVGILPGFRRNREFMETMMGVKEQLSPEIADRIQPHPSWRTPIGRLRRLRTGLSFLLDHFRIQGMVDEFLARFQREYAEFRGRDYDRMPSDRIFEAYLEMDRAMLGHWKAPIVNDFLTMVHFGLFRKLTAAWLADLDPNIQNDLLAGEGNLESAEPTRELILLAGEVAADPPLRKLVEETPLGDLMETLRESPFQELHGKIRAYIDRFGFRCMSEMKLEETDLFTDPGFLFACLRNYLRSGTTDLAAFEARKQDLRRDAEKRVAGALRGVRRLVYLWSMRQARKAVKNRENTRFARTRAYGVARTMFQAMGRDLCRRGVLVHPGDVFWLTLEEVYGIHQGTLPVYDLASYVEIRKREYARFESREPRSRFLTRGPVYWQNRFLVEDEASEPFPAGECDLRGLPCCPGIVEGLVKVVRSPRDDLVLDGEILVAPRTDPGWVPLYPSVSGLLVERGSLLSHSAIVAREMGIPAIVAIRGLTSTLKTGMRVRMDGRAGTIRILAAVEDATRAADHEVEQRGTIDSGDPPCPYPETSRSRS